MESSGIFCAEKQICAMSYARTGGIVARADRIDVDAHVVETSSGFARVKRRLGTIGNRVESLETHALGTAQRLDSIEVQVAHTDEHLGRIETHVERAGIRLKGIAKVAHIGSTLLKLS